MKKGVLLVVLALILAFIYVDRLALGVLLQDIKVEFALSDTQLGLLSGIAFSLFYGVMGLPIARWSDRGNRVAIISISTALWSAALALCGFAGNFLQLMLIRVGVAVGEAGCNPAAHSLIADYFTRADRARAVSIYMLAGPLSAVIGYFLAGWLNESFGWRGTFMILGTPGIALSLLAWLVLREPRHDAAFSRPITEAARFQPSVREVCATLWTNKTFRRLALCLAILSFFNSGIANWKPAFFLRSFGLQTTELGAWFAAIYGVSGLIGLYWGGAWASASARNNERLQLRTLAIALSSFALVSAGIYLASNAYVAFGLMAVAGIGGSLGNGPLMATIQTLVPDRMRAVAIALIYLLTNLTGLGLGPLVVGIISDALRPWLGEESLRYSLLAMCPGYFWAAWTLWQAGKSVMRDVEAAHIARSDGSSKTTAIIASTSCT
jgi:MFS transporter, Spinster family, sphingosine-1-phosphate transporter